MTGIVTINKQRTIPTKLSGTDWKKIAQLHDKWASSVIYKIPTRYFEVGSIIGFMLWIGSLTIDMYPKLATIFLFFSLLCYGRVMERNSRREGYVDGFSEGIEYGKGESTLDELIEAV